MYRVFTRAAAIAAVFANVVAPSFPAWAEPSELALQAPATLAQSGLQQHFAETLEARLQLEAARAHNEQDKSWLAQLRSFYLSRQGKPVWVSATGWTLTAKAAIAELRRAGDYGLDAEDYIIPVLADGVHIDEDLVAAEIGLSRAVVLYAAHARGGRIPDPAALSLWLGRTEDPVFATAVMIDVISNDDVAAVLRGMHPRFGGFERLRQAYAAMREEIDKPKRLPADETLEPGKTIKVGEWHPDVMIVRRRLKLPAADGRDSLFDERLANAIGKYMDERDVNVRWGRIDDKVRAVFNRPPKPPSKEDLDRIRANMERWRWLPRDLGTFHIWNNLPEFLTRVVDNGHVIHEERIIVGQPDTQTPIFSTLMRQVVFLPEWGVPPSIKINDLLPKLQSGDYDVLERRNMRILGMSGKELSPSRFNWDKVDIRDVGIFQRSGDGNPLGRVKFLFPNRHHVYMHDTNNRNLFKAEERTFSHGCVRVRNPEALAKVLLAHDKGWSEGEVDALLDDWDKPNNKIALDKPFPVHNVYFTIVSGPNNTLVKLDDIYGHDERVIQALSGVPFHDIAENDPARSQQRELEEAAPPMVRKALRERNNDDD